MPYGIYEVKDYFWNRIFLFSPSGDVERLYRQNSSARGVEQCSAGIGIWRDVVGDTVEVSCGHQLSRSPEFWSSFRGDEVVLGYNILVMVISFPVNGNTC